MLLSLDTAPENTKPRVDKFKYIKKEQRYEYWKIELLPATHLHWVKCEAFLVCFFGILEEKVTWLQNNKNNK